MAAERPVECVVVETVADQLHRAGDVEVAERVVQDGEPFVGGGLDCRPRPGVAGLAQPGDRHQGTVQRGVRVLRRADVVAGGTLVRGAHRLGILGRQVCQ